MKAVWFATTFQKSFAALMCFTGKVTLEVDIQNRMASPAKMISV